MSFEGRYNVLCENGHLSEWDIWSNFPLEDNSWRCPYCEAKLAWWTLVDETNGLGIYDEHGELVDPTKYPGEVTLEVIEPAKQCQCPTCGHVHYSAPERYKVPEDAGHKV